MQNETVEDTLDPHTGFRVRSDLCTGCGMCLLACAAIKQDVFSFSGRYAYIEVNEVATMPETFEVRFTEECDGCTYCLQFCGFDAIERPEDWTLASHLKEVRRRHQAERRAEVGDVPRG